MEDMQSFPIADKYEFAYKVYKDRKMSEEEYEEYLLKQDENSFGVAFCKARFSYFCKYLAKSKTPEDLINAKTQIDKAIFLLENSKNCIDSPEDFLSDGCMVNRSYISEIYMLAGEIYAECDEHDKSLSSYQKIQYHFSQLDSGFNNIENGGIVYSFRRVSVHALSDLIANSITVAHPSKMNDPFDSLFTLWASKGNMGKICKRKSHIPAFSESFNSYRIRSFVGNDTLTSDDRLVNNIIMWSHYADDHKGYCIRYWMSKHFIKKPNDGTFTHHCLRKIYYVPEEKMVSIGCSRMENNELFATKSNQWSGESEIRLVSYDSSHDGDFLQLKLDDCSEVEAIYFGYRCSDSDQRNIMSIVGEKANYYKMGLNPKNVYSMVVEQIFYNPSNKPSSDNNGDKLGSGVKDNV